MTSPLRFHANKKITALALIGVASLMVIPFFLRVPPEAERYAGAGAKDNPTEITVRRIGKLSSVCLDFRRRIGAWPTNISMLINATPIRDYEILFDGWGRQFVILSTSRDTNSIWLMSYGADGIKGGLGTNADFAAVLSK